MSANPASDKLLLTAAAGMQGRALLSEIASTWKNLRLVAHSDASAAMLRETYPEAEVVLADLADQRAVSELVKNVDVIFHIGPSFHPREAEIGLNIVDAAMVEHGRRAGGGVKHVVFSSVIGSQLRKMLHHDCKRPVEEALMESGLPYTILQPTIRMDMLPLKSLVASQTGGGDAPLVFRADWKPEVKTSFVTMRDQTDAARVVLEERERHYYAVYPLVSTPSPIPYADFVRRAVRRAGRDVEVSYRGWDASVAFFLNLFSGGGDNVDPYVRDALQRMLLYYNDRGLWGNPNQLEWLIGRKGQTVEEWADEVMARE